jgi:hypothetical protein
MLNRRQARAQAGAAVVDVPPAPVPVFAARASTARIPTDLAVVLHRTAVDLRRRLRRPAAGDAEPPTWRLWAGLGRSYVSGLLARARRSRSARTVTVFVVTAGSLGDRRTTRPPR